MERVIHVLTGCTAAGKTEWALRWAEARGAEIVSCDSLLFYRDMDIGTAKPSPAERARVPHHLVDILGLTERMDIARYVELARRTVEEIAARGRPVLVTGGSGFYLRAFFAPVADEVVVPAEIRAAVARVSLAEAVDELRRLHPGGLGALDTANPRRVARALERCRATGRSLDQLAADFRARPAPFAGWRKILTQLERAPADLERRIEARVEAMLAAGLCDEVRRLQAAGLRENPSAARAIGYREVLAAIDGRLAEGQLAAEIVKNTRALVKKQRTWFRTQMPPHRRVAAETATLTELFGD
jgi:tRNA dimethylallyltransferase